jgi:hypothetical protein
MTSTPTLAEHERNDPGCTPRIKDFIVKSGKHLSIVEISGKLHLHIEDVVHLLHKGNKHEPWTR